MPPLKLALIHSTVDHKQPKKNRENLLTLFRQAGEKGAQLVVGPELSLSGYSFSSRRDIAPYTETATGPTLTALADLARTYGFFACVGLAERAPQSGIFYNSAFVVGPTGEIVCRYRKINAECRWACSGDPTEDNTFDTPWGRVGVLICSDSYHSLMPRVTALRGANLLLIPANWPPSGLDPLEIWRARALENGFYVAGCNRTGRDLIMDCRQAPSAVISDQGVVHLEETAGISKLMQADIPLNSEGRLNAGRRLRCLSGRNREQMRACSLNCTGISDLTSLLNLPQPGRLRLCCHCPDPATGLQPILAEIKAGDRMADTLHILPTSHYTDADIEGLRVWCAAVGQKVVLNRITERGEVLSWFDGKEEPQSRLWNSDDGRSGKPFPVFDCGAARVHPVLSAALHHPELVLACAKQGADLVLIFNRFFNETVCLLAGARTIEQATVVVSSPQGAGIWMTPEGHQRWAETLAGPGEHCTAVLDTGTTRAKRFQDRIDYRTLLQEPLIGSSRECVHP